METGTNNLRGRTAERREIRLSHRRYHRWILKRGRIHPLIYIVTAANRMQSDVSQSLHAFGILCIQHALETNHHGIVSPSQRVNVPVGLSGPSSATRTASRAPSSTVSVPAYPLRFVLVKPGETALTLIPSGSNSIAMATVKALSAVLDAG